MDSDSGSFTGNRPAVRELYHNPEQSRWEISVSGNLRFRIVHYGPPLGKNAIRDAKVLKSSRIFLLHADREEELAGNAAKKAIKQIMEKLADPKTDFSIEVSYASVTNMIGGDEAGGVP